MEFFGSGVNELCWLTIEFILLWSLHWKHVIFLYVSHFQSKTGISQWLYVLWSVVLVQELVNRAGRKLSQWIYLGGLKSYADGSLGSNSALFHEVRNENKSFSRFEVHSMNQCLSPSCLRRTFNYATFHKVFSWSMVILCFICPVLALWIWKLVAVNTNETLSYVFVALCWWTT